MCVPVGLVARAARWADLKRWERRELGQDLRRAGLSYTEIREVIPVSKGTLSTWCRDIRLTEEQRRRLRSSRPSLAARSELGTRRRLAALEHREQIRSAGRREAEQLLGDPMWVAGVVAYWAEGDKRSGPLKFSNSDPDMIRLFVGWSMRYLDLCHDRFTIALHLHSGQDESERIAYWSGVTGLSIAQFRKTFIKPEGTGHRKNRLYNGTATIRVARSGALLHRVLGWIDAVRPLDRPLR